MSGFLGSGSSLYEIRESNGNTDLLIRDMLCRARTGQRSQR